MRGRDENVRSGNFGGLLCQCLCAIQHIAWQDAVVDHYDGELGFTVIEHKAAGVQLVVDFRGAAVGEAAGHGDAQPRSHIAGGRASTEDFVCGVGLEGGHKYEHQGKKAHKGNYKSKRESQSLSDCSLDYCLPLF